LRKRQEKAFVRGRELKQFTGCWIREDEDMHWDDLGRVIITSAKGKVRCII
jgi:hypothetical protein